MLMWVVLKSFLLTSVQWRHPAVSALKSTAATTSIHVHAPVCVSMHCSALPPVLSESQWVSGSIWFSVGVWSLKPFPTSIPSHIVKRLHPLIVACRRHYTNSYDWSIELGLMRVHVLACVYVRRCAHPCARIRIRALQCTPIRLSGTQLYQFLTLKGEGTDDGSVITVNWAGVQCPVISWQQARRWAE